MTHRIFPSTIFALVMMALVAGCIAPIAAPAAASTLPAATPAPSPDALDADTIAQIDAIAQKQIDDQATPGLALCVVKDGALAYSKGFGLADVESQRPMTPQSVSLLYSVAKPLTAMAVMQLVEQGKVDLDAPVTTYLPDFKMANPRYADITVRMLLEMRSGIPDYATLKYIPGIAADSLQNVVLGLSNNGLQSDPGESWTYSTLGFSLAGAVVEAVAGQPYAEYMQEHWLTPLGMSNSTFVTKEVDPSTQAFGYSRGATGTYFHGYPECDDTSAPGCTLWSTCEDMSRVAQMVLNGGTLDGTQFLQPETLATMTKGVNETGFTVPGGALYSLAATKYGLGWASGQVEGHRNFGHGGGGSGYDARFEIAPDDGVAIIALANQHGYAASHTALDVLFMLLGIEQ